MLSVFAMASMVACSNDEPVETPELKVDKTSVSLAATEAEASFSVTSNLVWTASADTDWISFEPASGEPSEKPVEVKITAEDNMLEEVRTAKITVQAGELTETVVVTQAAADAPVPPAPPAPEYTIDHKQWIGEFDGLPMLIDLDIIEEGALVIALPLMDNSGYGMYMYGIYVVTVTDGTSGVITFVQYDPEWDEFLPEVEIAYSNLTATTVDLASMSLFGADTPVAFTLVENPYDIELDAGGDGAQGEIEDGVYWFIEPTNNKVMSVLDESSSYGRPSAVDAIDGASTAKNAYTFTYDPDWSSYTIQDSYGRYLYQGMQSDGTTPYRTISLSTTLPASDDESRTFYMWTVYNNGDGTYDVYNEATYYSITYSESYNNWEVYDPYESDFANLFPTLVKADNPVEEPEPEPMPEGAYVYTFAQGDLGQNGSPVSEVVLGGLNWKFSMTDSGSKYLGWDQNYGKGIQIGKSKDPATEVILSTSGIEGTISAIKVNTAGASGTDAVLNVMVGGAAFGNEAAIAMESADYTFTGAAKGEIVLKWTATQKAIYVKSIEIVYE